LSADAQVAGEAERIDGDAREAGALSRGFGVIHRVVLAIDIDGSTGRGRIGVGTVNEGAIDLPEHGFAVGGKHADISASHALHGQAGAADIDVAGRVVADSADAPESEIAHFAMYRAGKYTTRLTECGRRHRQ
jgi:hypothetical protein